MMFNVTLCAISGVLQEYSLCVVCMKLFGYVCRVMMSRFADDTDIGGIGSVDSVRLQDHNDQMVRRVGRWQRELFLISGK